jgi:hypothetical protein
MPTTDSAGRALSRGMLLLFAIALTSPEPALLAAEQTSWQPATTRAFIVSLARFQGDRLHSFSPDERLDDRFAQLFQERGIPASQILLLKDEQATSQNIRQEFTTFLRKSKPGETLLFYFGSHGAFDPETGKYSFCAFDDDLSFTWALNAIERDFRGSRALLMTDCCYSGGMVDLIAARKSSVAYACLSSTYSHQTAWSGWRFMQCLMRGFAGNPVVDLDGDGNVGLDELAVYTEGYMAFAAEGKPMFTTAHGFPAKLQLAKVTKEKAPRSGELVEVNSGTKWEKAEIVDARGPQFKAHFTKDTRSKDDVWIPQERIRAFEFKPYPVGFSVEVQDSSEDAWHSARALNHWKSLHWCRYDGRSSIYDEWFGPNRIRAGLAGSWSGTWKNDLKESGPETLNLHLDEGDQIRGTWSGNVTVKGERLANDMFIFEGSIPNRFYRCVGRIEAGQVALAYCAHRDQGHYHGCAALRRSGEVPDPVWDPRAEFAGNWTGSYENSGGGSGVETLELSEQDDQLMGNWSGVRVSGERIGPATFYLAGTLGERKYRVVGRVTKGRLALNYSATTGSERYVGWSTLAH